MSERRTRRDISVLPFVEDADFTLYVGDALEVLREMRAASVHCCVTSPPYWGLRDYGHDGQLGLEATPDEYVARLVDVFREVRRVLRDDGTLWLNLGDSYVSNGFWKDAPASTTGAAGITRVRKSMQQRGPGVTKAPGRKPKDLVGIPWLVAFALQSDGWYLRSDIVWHKPNAMPESVTDRPTKAHEYVFLLTKSSRYYYDADSIREPAAWERWGDQTVPKYEGTETASGWIQPKTKREIMALADHRYDGLVSQRWRERKGTGEPGRHGHNPDTKGSDVGERGQKNARSVWSIPTQPYPDAHFAVFPDALPRRCILAGCPEDGSVLDPFLGSGTTALAARGLGRSSVGIELNPEYAALCARRLQQQSLLTEGAA